MSTIRDKATWGVKWNSISQVGKQGIQMLTTIILARLLPPADFGLIGMAIVVIGFIEIFKDLGTTAAIIQRKDTSELLLSSVFWVNLGFGVVVTTILFLGAPLGGAFYNEPRVIAVLRVLSFNFIISSLSILQQALFERELAFQALAKVEISAMIIGAVVGIGLALIGQGVWSLVFQSLVAVSITTVFLWLTSSWRPKLIFHWSEVKSISRFSLNLVGFNIFNYLSRNADYLLIGRYLGTQDLGYYTLAYRILLFPLQSISNVIRRVVFPVYSSIQDDNSRFSKIYLNVAKTIALISFPMMLGILSVAKPFILVFFGDKWQPVIPLIMILAPVGMSQSIGTMTGTIYQAKGRTDWMLRWGIGAGTVYIFAFLIGLKWGITGVATAYAIAVFCLTYFNHAISFKLIGLKFSQLIKVLNKSLCNSLLMLLAVLLTQYALSSKVSNLFLLGLSIAIGIMIYAFMNFITNRQQLQELWMLIRQRVI